MPSRDGYPQGVPCWVDLQTTDQEGAKAFYSGLFGWEIADEPLPMGGHYSMGSLDGGAVAGIGAQAPGTPEGMPPIWATYFWVDDLDEVVGKVEGAGGQVVVPPMDVMETGRMAFVVDPTGAHVGLWEANQHKGAGTVNQPGALVWNELITTDPEAAATFYDAILGTTHDTSPMGDSDYTVVMAGDRGVAGIMSLPEHQGVPTAWTVYFGAEDIDATVAKAQELGGTILNQVDTPVGPIAVIADPQGGVFQAMQPTEYQD